MLLYTHYIMMSEASQPSNGSYITHEMETQCVLDLCDDPITQYDVLRWTVNNIRHNTPLYNSALVSVFFSRCCIYDESLFFILQWISSAILQIIFNHSPDSCLTCQPTTYWLTLNPDCI